MVPSPAPSSDATETEMRQMEEWLVQKRLQRYIALLNKHEVNRLEDLMLLTPEDLTNMGITAIGARRKLLCCIAELRNELNPPGQESMDITTHASIPLVVFSSEGSKGSEGGNDHLPQVTDKKTQGPRSTNGNTKNALPDIQSRFKELSDEHGVLESISEAASLLLKFEKEDSVTHASYIPERFQNHSMNVDMGPIRERMQKRIAHFLRVRTPPGSARPMESQQDLLQSPKGPKKAVNYQDLINEQTRTIAQLEHLHQRYRQLLDECLNAVTADLEKHSLVGEYRDAAEYRLKMQLGKLIGVYGAEDGAEAEYHAQLGATEATQKRRQQIQQRFEEMVRNIDADGNGLLDDMELREALANNKEFQEELEVMAFNLALDPENRMISDDEALNADIQAQVEALIHKVDANGDGYLSKEEIRQLTPKSRLQLSKLGLPPILGRSASICQQ